MFVMMGEVFLVVDLYEDVDEVFVCVYYVCLDKWELDFN